LDFARVFEHVAGFLEARGFPCALAGALALHARGYSRATFDLDLITATAARTALVTFLESAGYRTLHASEGFTNHAHDDPDWGRVDVIYVDDDTGRRLFAGCTPALTLGARRALVPRPEHLAAMKVHALRNDPTRLVQDLADVQHLLSLPGVDHDEVRGYFERAGLLDWYERIAAAR
jgi:hypothetical protein